MAEDQYGVSGCWKKQKAQPIGLGLLIELSGRRPTLPHTCACSTIGAERLNFRVRDGNGWDPLAMVTQHLIDRSTSSRRIRTFAVESSTTEYLTGYFTTFGILRNAAQVETENQLCVKNKFYGQAERAISNSKLNVLLRLHICPIKLVVFQCSSYFRWEISS